MVARRARTVSRVLIRMLGVYYTKRGLVCQDGKFPDVAEPCNPWELMPISSKTHLDELVGIDTRRCRT